MRWTAQMQDHEIVATAEQLEAFKQTYVLKFSGHFVDHIPLVLLFALLTP